MIPPSTTASWLYGLSRGTGRVGREAIVSNTTPNVRRSLTDRTKSPAKIASKRLRRFAGKSWQERSRVNLAGVERSSTYFARGGEVRRVRALPRYSSKIAYSRLTVIVLGYSLPCLTAHSRGSTWAVTDYWLSTADRNGRSLSLLPNFQKFAQCTTIQVSHYPV